MDIAMIKALVKTTNAMLRGLGYTTFTSHYQVGIDGTHGVTIATNCNGFSLMALYSGFIIAFFIPVITKLWALLIGNLVIFFLNTIRLALLAIVVKTNPAMLEFHHKYTFTLLMYGVIIFMWWYWSAKYRINEVV